MKTKSKKLKRQLKQARNYGRLIASRMFKDFQDENNQGANFTWSMFPDMVAGLAEANVFTSFAEDIGPDIEQEAARYARACATVLVMTLNRSDSTDEPGKE